MIAKQSGNSAPGSSGSPRATGGREGLLKSLVFASIVLAGLSVVLSALALLYAAGILESQRDSPDIESRLQGYLLANPEVLIESVNRLQARRQAAENSELSTVIAQRHDEIFNDPDSPVALGATATAFSRLLLFYRYEATLVGGTIVIVLGVFMTGLVRMPWFERDVRFHRSIPGGRPLGAFVLGLAFGFGWTPCIGPVLGAILTVSALSSTAAAGIVLLAVYSLGLGVPFLLSAVFADHLMQRLKSMRRLGRTLQVGAGGVMVAMGIAMITGTITAFSLWLLENVPPLARIG